jgi:hypothetical protein
MGFAEKKLMKNQGNCIKHLIWYRGYSKEKAQVNELSEDG